VKIQKYSPQNEGVWNVFIEHSKNGTFMLNRSYMDYHSDRFVDRSLMFYDDKERLVALLPASLHGHELRSHGGLTYGGIISDRKMTTEKMLEIFSSLKQYMLSEGIEKLLYKRVPSIYYTYPSDEDLYALFINDAKLVRRDISTAIYLPDRISFAKGKKWGVSKSKQAGIIVKEFSDFNLFFDCENKLLQSKYSVSAVHSPEEMALLASRFPENIKMLGAFLNDEFASGTILFISNDVVHTQYIVNTELGRSVQAFDGVVNYLIDYYRDKKFFDFGISTEQNGRYLNEGLIRQKEMFGGRAVAYDFYELTV